MSCDSIEYPSYPGIVIYPVTAAALYTLYTNVGQSTVMEINTPLVHGRGWILNRPRFIVVLLSLRSLKGKEGSVLFNDTLNTFHFRLYGIRHMVNDHSDSEREKPLPPHGLLFPINSNGYFICTIP